MTAKKPAPRPDRMWQYTLSSTSPDFNSVSFTCNPPSVYLRVQLNGGLPCDQDFTACTSAVTTAGEVATGQRVAIVGCGNNSVCFTFVQARAWIVCSVFHVMVGGTAPAWS